MSSDNLSYDFKERFVFSELTKIAIESNYFSKIKNEHSKLKSVLKNINYEAAAMQTGDIYRIAVVFGTTQSYI